MDLNRRTFGSIAAGLYLASGLLVLADFLMSPPDGLANVAIALHVFPVTALGALTGLEFPYVPHSLGYYSSHVAYFVPALIVCTLALRRIIGGPGLKADTER